MLVYPQSLFTVRLVEQQWAQTSALATSLVPVLTGSRRGVMATGPWSATALVKLGGVPRVTSTLVPEQAGVELPPVLRIEVGPMVWELCDVAAWSSMLAGWRRAADLLAVGNPDA